MKTRGERLRARRNELGLTLREVAEKINVSIPGVSNLERNSDVMPSLEIGVALAECYEKSVNWILNGVDDDGSRIPVTGTTDTGPLDFTDDNSTIERYIPFSSSKLSAGVIYSLTISNQLASGSLYPVGDVLLIDPAMQLVCGEDVLVKTTSGKVDVLRLARIVDETYYLDAQDQTRFVLNKSQLILIHQIVGVVKGFIMEKR